MLAISGALLTLGLGFFGAFWPDRAAAFVGISPQGGRGRSEVRATYGGLFMALGGACLYLQSPEAYFVAGAAWTGAAAMRVPSLLLDKGSYPMAIGGAVLELTVGLLLLTGAN